MLFICIHCCWFKVKANCEACPNTEADQIQQLSQQKRSNNNKYKAKHRGKTQTKIKNLIRWLLTLQLMIIVVRLAIVIVWGPSYLQHSTNVHIYFLIYLVLLTAGWLSVGCYHVTSPMARFCCASVILCVQLICACLALNIPLNRCWADCWSTKMVVKTTPMMMMLLIGWAFM